MEKMQCGRGLLNTGDNAMSLDHCSHFLLFAELNRRAVASFADYPFSLPAVRNLERLDFHPAVTFLVGENGTGKSTLLEAIAVGYGFNAEGGSKNFNFETRASHSPLHQYLRLARGFRRPKDGFFLRAESFYNVATQVETLGVTGYGSRSLHDQSHGESFWALLMERFRGNGLYILDEPEAALSPARQLAALVRIRQLVKSGSQLVIATHSPILMAYPEATIFRLSEDGICKVNYSETEHFQLTKRFMENPERILKELFREENGEE
jgi:predicted ATPase